MNATVSVVIPVKDDADRLERCLEALHRQTRRPDEIVVVDNGSADLSATVAGWWGARCIRQDRVGIAPAASAGYDAATGDILARLDADSVPPADWVSRILAAWESDPGLDALTGPGSFPSLPAPLAGAADVLYMRAYFDVFGHRLGRPPLFGSNFAMTREAWRSARERVHRDDPEVHDDLDLSFALAPGSRVLLDRTLRVAISARPFADPRAFGRRVMRGMHTLRLQDGGGAAGRRV